MTTVAPAPHECEGNLIFTDYGLGPYWAITKALIGGFDWDGSESVETEINGEPSVVQFNYTKGGIAPREDDSVRGERLYEARLRWEGRGQRKAHFLIQPRFPGMRQYETGEPVSTPFDHTGLEGVNVRFQGSNLELDEYPEILAEVVQVLGDAAELKINENYLATSPHGMSNIMTFELYLRILREWSMKLVGRSGTMHRLVMLFAEEVGSQYELKVDNTEITGKNTRCVLCPESARQLISGHRLAKQIKHYHPKHVRSKNKTDPLYHPKVGVLFRKKPNGGTVPWGERHELRRELEETLVNVLYWSDIPVRPDPTTYVADDHFEVLPSDSLVSLEEDPTPSIEAKQEALFLSVMRDLEDSDIEVLEALVEHGGGRHPKELAKDTGRGISTMYRALQRLEGLLRNNSASVSFASKKIEQDALEILGSLDHQVMSTADRVAKLYNIDFRMRESSSWQQFCNKYHAKLIQVASDHEGATLRIDTMLTQLKSMPQPVLKEVLSEAVTAWNAVGRDVLDLEQARLQWRDEGGNWRHGKVRPNLR